MYKSKSLHTLHPFFFHYTEKFRKIKHQQRTPCIFWQEGVMPMDGKRLYCAGGTAAARYAGEYLGNFYIDLAERPGSSRRMGRFAWGEVWKICWRSFRRT